MKKPRCGGCKKEPATVMYYVEVNHSGVYKPRLEHKPLCMRCDMALSRNLDRELLIYHDGEIVGRLSYGKKILWKEFRSITQQIELNIKRDLAEKYLVKKWHRSAYSGGKNGS